MSTMLERFWSKVAITNPDECWEWQGATAGQGYGVLMTRKVGRKTVMEYAHRISWQLAHQEPIPSDMEICHICDNPRCVNPAHLFVGTKSDNMQDSARKGRNGSQTHPERLARGDNHPSHRHPERVLRGESHPTAIMTWDKVRELRTRYASGERHIASLAQSYGVNWRTVDHIVRGDTWRDSQYSGTRAVRNG